MHRKRSLPPIKRSQSALAWAWGAQVKTITSRWCCERHCLCHRNDHIQQYGSQCLLQWWKNGFLRNKRVPKQDAGDYCGKPLCPTPMTFANPRNTATKAAPKQYNQQSPASPAQHQASPTFNSSVTWMP